MSDHLDSEILPADQRRAADLADACLDGNADRVGELLAELLDVGIERTLAALAVQSRNLAALLMSAYGIEQGKRMLANTRWDATVAE